MVREIKFRAWDKENNKFFKPTYRAYAGELEDLSIEFSGDLTMRTLEQPAIHESLFPDRFILQQYTGLKDKNGREIYEGDIVQFRVNKFSGNGIQTTMNKGFVYYTEDMTLSVDGWILAKMNSREVVGNIYENPELLKEESQ